MSAKLSVVRSELTIQDYALVESKIKERITVDVPRSKAFSRYVLESFFHVPENDFAIHLLDGGNDRGADIIFIDHNEQTINICNCKCVTKFENSKKNFPGVEIDKIISLVSDIVRHNEDALRTSNVMLIGKIQEIWQIFEDGDPYRLNVHLFSNQTCLVAHERERLITSLSNYNVKLFEHGLYQLAHGVVRSAMPKFKKTLRPEKNSSFSVAETLSGIQTRVSLTELYNFVTHEGIFDERLVMPNVRYFLGLDNPVNKSIKQSLLSGECSNFWALNNGITIVCDSITNQGENFPIHMSNPKLVNGCQTASVIFDVGLNTLKKLPIGTVTVKIVITSDEDLIRQIALACNTQSRISNRDLMAVDVFQSKLALLINDMGYFYRRKRGETAPAKRKTIDMARAGQILLAYVFGEPTKSKTSSNEIFSSLYEEAFDPNRTTAELIVAGYLIHEEIERQRAPAIEKQRLRARSSFDEHWIIEGHYHVLFVVGELMRDKNFNLADSSRAIAFIPQAIEIVGEFAARNSHRASYRLFRLTSSKSELLRFVDTSSDDKVRGIQLTLDF